MTDKEFWFIQDNIEHAFKTWAITFDKYISLKMKLISYYNRNRWVK